MTAQGTVQILACGCFWGSEFTRLTSELGYAEPDEKMKVEWLQPGGKQSSTGKMIIGRKRPKADMAALKNEFVQGIV